MKRKFLALIIFLSLSNATYANWFQDIIDHIDLQGGITNNFLGSINSQQREILTSQKDIEDLMKQVHGGLTSHSGWGTYSTHDYQSYGDGAHNWTSVMQMADGGSGSGALGQAMSSISSQFPMDKIAFNKGVQDANSQKYYSLKSQTILATRAASQLDYDKIQEQIAYQQMLQAQIEKTNDLKSAVDLNNRIQVESNLISLEILRQSALANQQQSINEQANVNSALSNAKFLTKN